MSSVARPAAVVLLAALGAAALRVPWLNAPLGSDEGGLLLVAGQWHRGASFYGDYWVDRPPLLIAMFAVSHVLGGAFALRILGCAAAATTVALAARLGRCAGGDAAEMWCAVAAAAFVSSALFDAHEVTGELLATPFVLGGFLAVMSAREASGSRRTRLLAAAGVIGGRGFSRQAELHRCLRVPGVLQRDRADRRAPRPVARLAWVGGGALVTLSAALAGSALLGTTPGGLRDAVVVFRAEAARVIATSASSATHDRLVRLPGVMLVSGAVLIIVLAVLRALTHGRPEPATAGLFGVLSWEAFAIVGGGSYWLHYLMGLVPGMVLGTSLAVRGRDRLAPTMAVSYAAAVTTVVTVAMIMSPTAPSSSQMAGRWLEHHRRPGDTAWVAYDRPNVLAESGTTSPYPDLWSLPIKVHDPRLRALTAVLDGEHASGWILVDHDLSSWGVDPSLAQTAVDQHYREAADVCGYEVYLRDGLTVRTAPPHCRPGAANDPPSWTNIPA